MAARRLVMAMAVVAVVLAFAQPASATSCTNLQTDLNNVALSTVTLDPGTCDAPAGGFTITRQLTLQGSPGGSTIDGSTLTSGAHILTLTNARMTTVRDLTLKNANRANDGPALEADLDSSPTLDRLQLYGNTASSVNARGGAVFLNPNSAHPTEPLIVRDSIFGSTAAGGPNSATLGGGLAVIDNTQHPVQITGSRFIGNHANSAGGLGGGAYLWGSPLTVSSSTVSDNTARSSGGGILVCGPSTLTANTFARNSVFDAGGHQPSGGGGVFRYEGHCFDAMTQTDNLFDHNTVTFGADPPGGAAGGGEFATTPSFTSRGDRFIGNELQVPATVDAEGAGLALEGCNSANPANHTVENLVSAGNRFSGSGAGSREGAGLYIGCSEGPATVTLLDSTIAGNNSGGSGTPGLFGGPDDVLTMRNSIVAANAGGADFSGFGSKAASFSDACPLLAGTGNLCADPLLANPGVGDVHETGASPTLDKGSTALVPSALTTDFEGQPRIQGSAVDIGADELPPATVDGTPPGVSAASIGKTFAVAKGSTPVNGQAAARRKRKKPKRGTTIRYTLSEAASVSLRIDRRLTGRRVRKGKKRVCVKPTRKNRKKRKCTRLRKAGTLTRKSKAGRNRVKFTGRIGRKALKPGSYQLTIVATDAAGNKSKPKRLRFKVVRAR